MQAETAFATQLTAQLSYHADAADTADITIPNVSTEFVALVPVVDVSLRSRLSMVGLIGALLLQ